MSKITFYNPDGLPKNPAFSQVAVTSGQGDTVYIGGQNAVNEQLEIVGKGNLSLQTGQALNNLETALQASGATLDDLFKLTIYVVQGQDIRDGFAGAQTFLGKLKNPPVISVLVVSGLASPDFLVEIEGMAYKGK